jgi:hypothetical protein
MGRLLQRWSGKFVPYSPARAAGATNAVWLPNRANQEAELKVLPKKTRREAGLYPLSYQSLSSGRAPAHRPSQTCSSGRLAQCVLLAIVEGEAGETARSDEGAAIAAGIGEEVLDLDAPVRGEGVFDAGTGGIPEARVVALLAVKKVGTPPMVPTIVFG